MASEELLSSCNNVSNDDGGSQREEDVLIVWVKNKSTIHLACTSKRVRNRYHLNQTKTCTTQMQALFSLTNRVC